VGKEKEDEPAAWGRGSRDRWRFVKRKCDGLEAALGGKVPISRERGGNVWLPPDSEYHQLGNGGTVTRQKAAK